MCEAACGSCVFFCDLDHLVPSLCNRFLLTLKWLCGWEWFDFSFFQYVGEICITNRDVNPAFSCHAQLHESRERLS